MSKRTYYTFITLINILKELERRIKLRTKYQRMVNNSNLKNAVSIISDIIGQHDCLLSKIESEYPIKEKLSKEEFIEYLQGICCEIHSAILKTENYVLNNHNINNIRLRRLSSRYAKLNKTYDDCKKTLLIIGGEINKELEEFYDDIDSKLFVNKDVIENPNTEQLKKLKSGLNQKSSYFKVSKSFKEFDWFKIGLLFAQGKPQILYNKYKQEKGCFNLITEELDIKESNRPYISETLNDNNKGSQAKNIYSLDKMEKIIKHCEENSITIDKVFLKKRDSLKAIKD